MTGSKVWFITGASSGFGRTMTEYLLKQGHKVVATLRKPEVLSDLAKQYPSSQLVIVKVDVTKNAEVVAAFAKAKEAFGRIDVVFNNAGRGTMGEVESVTLEDAHAMFDVNFWGLVNVTREAVHFFRDVNQPPGGRLLQMSSVLGVSSPAAYSYYSATKFAVEGLSESLAAELNPEWNIKVTLLEPGPFHTQMPTSVNVSPPHPAYAGYAPATKFRKDFGSDEYVDGDPYKACVAFEKVSRLEDPPIRFPLHRMAIQLSAEKGKSLVETAEKYKNCSDDIYL